MARKSGFWISIGITAFLLFLLTGVLNAVSTQSDFSIQQAALLGNPGQSAAADQTPIDVAALPVSKEKAIQIAQSAAPDGSTASGSADLVNFQGSVAYEIAFGSGNIYVDANSGALLYNAIATPTVAGITPEQAAFIAANYLRRTDVVSVSPLRVEGMDVYRVDFTIGDVVLISQQGQILLVHLAPGTGESGEGQESEN